VADGGAGGIGRLLVRLPNWLGDLMLARPLLHALRHHHPRAELCAVAPAGLLDLIGAEGVVDRSEAWPGAGSARRALAARLRAWGPDAALVLPPSFSSAWFAWRCGARVRVGYRHEARGPLLTHALRRRARGDLHLHAEYLALGAVLGVDPGATPILALPRRAAIEAGAVLERRGVSSGRHALLGPGALYGPAKRWGIARFAELGRRLVSDGRSVLVCGSAAERDTCEAVARAVGRGATPLAGETGLLAQAALCAGSAVAVCNDSGLAHLSAAVGAPTVVLFGSTSSAWTSPLGPRVRVVQKPPVCSPCFRRTCAIGYRCLEAITVDDVARACAEIAA